MKEIAVYPKCTDSMVIHQLDRQKQIINGIIGNVPLKCIRRKIFRKVQEVDSRYEELPDHNGHVHEEILQLTWLFCRGSQGKQGLHPLSGAHTVKGSNAYD